MKKFWKALLDLFVGALIGFINGFLGGGGGMLTVPYLQYVDKLPNKNAHATAIAVILPVTIASAIVYITSGTIKWDTTLYVSGGVLLGGIAGALLLNKLQNKVIGIIFAILMVGAGIRMLF